MIGSSITRRYAEALVSIGVEENRCDTFENELKQIVDVLEKNIELRNVVFSSVYPQKNRKAILKDIIKRLQLSETIENFLNLLIDKNRIEFLPHIVNTYEEIIDKREGRLRATVTVAQQIPNKSIERLKKAFQSSTGKEVVIEIEEDPSIIGGAITKLGHVVYDGSIKSHLERLKRSMIRGEEV
ncbi:MAG: ATP synthase F1 subunit delta [Thermodesulfobacteriota bacterium]|nr:ATP synthase F1 subunit delta [Thermodesulfobacteriota bacterium]